MPRKSTKSDAAMAITDIESASVAPVKKARSPAKPRVAKAPAPVSPAIATSVSTEPSLAQVAEEAYLLWMGEGQPEGRDMEHWLLAEQIVRSRLSLLSAAVHHA